VVLPQHNRLKRSRDFSRVYRYGEKAVSRHLILRALFDHQSDQSQAEPSLSEEQEQPPTRIGISVSQKVSKRAVIRNRLKRQVRAAVRILLPRLKPGIWLVINLRPGAIECEYGEFLRELEELLTKLEVLHGHS
jgi:ribonuclease P protein component